MLAEQMAEQWGVTEELKMQDQMEWVRRMNNIQATAEEKPLPPPTVCSTLYFLCHRAGLAS